MFLVAGDCDGFVLVSEDCTLVPLMGPWRKYDLEYTDSSSADVAADIAGVDSVAVDYNIHSSLLWGRCSSHNPCQWSSPLL